MSGAGRKGNYRKGVTDEVLNGNPVPEEGEIVARVIGSRGGNVIEIICGDNTEGLAVMPQKFRKLVWVKRGDFVIVSGASTDIEVTKGNGGAIRYRVKYILYKDQIRHIKKVGVWPSLFSEGEESEGTNDLSLTCAAAESEKERKIEEETIVNTSKTSGINWNKDSNLNFGQDDKEEGEYEEEYESEEDDSDLFVNTNRRKAVAPPSSDEEESDEEE